MRLGANNRDLLSIKDGFAARRARGWRMAASSLVLALVALGPARALAEEAAPIATEPSDIVVNGVPYHETVLPTRLKLDSIYGMDLNVMDTPRNATLLSTTQLETLNIQDPRAFSYLTSSSYSDSSFGTPNIPRIRGQYGDVYYNGMRYSFSQNGYGVPLNFDDLANISITKGPAGVIDGPGPNVGGEVDFMTKRPNLSHYTYAGSASIDTIGNHRLVADVGGPVIPGQLGFLLSYSGENSSNSYFSDHFFRKNALYAAVRWQPTNKYQLDFNAEVNVEQYTEEVGVNRVNQNLIDHGQYLQGAPVGELDSSVFFANDGVPIPVGLAAGFGSPYSAAPFFTETNLTNSVKIDPKTTIDQTQGVLSRGKLYNVQLIQSYDLTNNLTVENNTFFAYQDSDNQEPYYYADASNGSYSFESRTDLKGDFNLKFGDYGIKNQFVFGFTYRYAHTNYISNFSAEAVSVYDLTANPNLWRFPEAYQQFANAFPYQSPFGATQYGVPGRDVVGAGNTGVSNLFDTGVFFQDRMVFSPQWSLLYGARIDAVQNHTYDPIGGDVCDFCFTDLPRKHTTGVFGLGEANASVVYRPASWISGYLTVDWTQSNNSPNGGEGGLNTYGQVPDSFLLRTNNYLYEAGVKINALDNKLFGGLAVFDQKRRLPDGPGGTQSTPANIRGVEVEFNYQPNRNLFATASYSYIKTTLERAPIFYDYPAEPGIYIDGSASEAVFKPGQTFDDPGIPEQVFNFLGNYKFDSGFGIRSGIQVTGPIHTTASGYLDTVASSTVFGTYVPEIAQQIAGVTNAQGYYKSPVIPWQFTWNASMFYQINQYIFTLSIYNLTDQHNWQPSPNEYGNDFLVLSDPRTVEARVQVKF